MAAWRRRALVACPDLHKELQRHDYSIYHLFFDLLPMVREAHAVRNVETLRRVYGFAGWCLRQKEKGLWNPAGTAFYEHLFDGAEDEWVERAAWIPSDIEQVSWPLWELRLGPEKRAKLKLMFAASNAPLPKA